MSSIPAVSVLIPTFESATWVGEAIESALLQKGPSLEVRVLDDGSTDRTSEVLRGFGDRIVWERTENRGSNPTRNRLLAAARGTWLQYLDADDLLLPGKLERQVRVGDASGADLVASPCIYDSGQRKHAASTPDVWCSLLLSQLGVTSSNLFRREAVAAAGGWKEGQAASQEYELMLRILMGGGRALIDDAALTRKRGVNAASLRQRDLRTASHAAIGNVLRAVDHLREHGWLDGPRRGAAGRRLFREAARLFSMGDPEYPDALHAAETLDAGLGFLCERPRGYRLAFTGFGFETAERLHGTARRAKAFLRRGVVRPAAGSGIASSASQ